MKRKNFTRVQDARSTGIGSSCRTRRPFFCRSVFRTQWIRKTLLCGHYVLLWPYASEMALEFTQTYLPDEINFVLLLERSISIKLLEFLYLSLFVSGKYLDKDSFLSNISSFVGAGSNLFIGVYYLSLVIFWIRD
jgi:hypothetical protein